MFGNTEYGEGLVDNVHLDGAEMADSAIITERHLVVVEQYVDDPAGVFEIPDDVRYFLDYVL